MTLPLPLLLYLASLLLAILLAASLAWFAWRQPDQPGVYAYAWIMAAASLVGAAELLSVLAPNQAWAHFWFQLRFLFLAPLPVLWLRFALDYTGYREWLSARIVAGLLAVPLLTQFVLWSNGLHGLWVRQDVGFVQVSSFWITQIGEREPGVWFLFYSIYSALISMAGVGLILHQAWRLRRDFGQISIVLAAPLLPILVGILPILSLPNQSRFNLLVPAIGISGLLSAVGVFRFDFLRRHPVGGSRSPSAGFDQSERRILSLLALIFVLIVSGVVVTGVITYQRYASDLRVQVQRQLSAVASLKAEQLAEWRRSRLFDASIFSENEHFTQHVRLLVDDPQNQEARTQLLTWLHKLEAIPQYSRIILVDPEGNELLAFSLDPTALSTNHKEWVDRALAANQPLLMGFHQHQPGGPVVLGVILPIVDAEPEKRVLGTLILEIDPAVYLFPFIQRWPVPTDSAETLLVRQEGEEVVFLNALRFHKDAALSLRQPLTRTDLPAVKAVLGQTGIVEGVDYRGEAVIADLRPIPDSPWFLVSKIDTAEAYAPLRSRLWESLLVYSLIIFAIGMGLWQVWRLQQVRSYQEKLAAAEALAASEELFRTAFLTNPDAVTITRLSDGQYRRTNQGFTHSLGYAESEVVGKTSLELAIWEDTRDRNAYAQALLDTGVVQNREVRLRRKDGTIRLALVSASLIDLEGEPHALTIARDITEHRRAEIALRETAETRLRLIEYATGHSTTELLVRTLDEVCPMVDSPIGFYHFVEPDQRTLSLQAWSTATIQDYCQAEGEGLHYDLETAGVWADCVRQRQPVIHNDYASLPNRRGLPAGHAALVSELVVPIQREGLIVAILGVGNKANDYTEEDLERVTYFADVAWEIIQHKRAEEQLARYTEKLEEMVEARTQELQEANERLVRQERLAALGQLAGSIGHELRNPLGVLSNAAYLLRLAQPDANGKVREYLSIIDSEIQASNKIISDLLDYTRIKSLDRGPADAAELVRQTLERHPAPATVQVFVDLPSDLPLVYADAQHTVQILGNLITNGYQAMETGGRLTLSAWAEDEMVAIAVQDTGVGILPKNIGKLFEPLFTTKINGIGLGLPVSQKLAEASRGYITVTSEPGSGSIFTLYLPAHKEGL